VAVFADGHTVFVKDMSWGDATTKGRVYAQLLSSDSGQASSVSTNTWGAASTYILQESEYK
jgi:hypothetical protein